ncbi:hypothetical protein B0J11DRAFT_529216 [Dendryphion nanum]|uniref:Pentatricopeptide repeat-containing protein n=1 Tax=Dendryphion nanum TaxID=256645 RepID=A0A9P9IKN2_9PLEO|nr:hypothetical protein B0J11DRAFT_529216 [Dendryphion nanum]
MPSVRLSDLRCFTDVNAPILPFLAPRIFSRPPSSTTRPFKNARILSQTRDRRVASTSCLGGTAGVQDKSTLDRCIGITRGGSSRNSTHQNGGVRFSSSRPVLLASQAKRTRMASLNSPNHRYADIAAFTHAQVRAYSASVQRLVEEPGANMYGDQIQRFEKNAPVPQISRNHRERRIRLRKAVHSISAKTPPQHKIHTLSMLRGRQSQKSREIRQQIRERMGAVYNSVGRQRLAFLRYKKLALFRSLLIQKERRWRTHKTLRTIRRCYTNTGLRDVRVFKSVRYFHRCYLRIKLDFRDLKRQVVLVKTQRRYEMFVNYRGDEHDWLMRRGEYRSLMRRLFNLHRKSLGVIDFSQDLSQDTRLGGKFGEYFILTRGFASLDIKVFPTLQQATWPLKIKHNPKCKEWALLLFKDCGIMDEEKMLDNWAHLDETAHQHWHLLLLYLLDIAPKRAVEFLRILAQDQSLSVWPEILADALEHIARVYVIGRQHSTSLTIRHFIPTFCSIFETHLSQYAIVCSDDLFFNVGRLSSLDDLRIVWRLITANKRGYVGYHTCLQYARLFADYGECIDALLCLKEVAKRTSKFDDLRQREEYLFAFAGILRKGVGGGKNYHMTNIVVSDFLALGIKLDTRLYNIMIFNSVEAQDLDTAFRVFGHMEKHGVDPDKYTYSILLHGCMTANDPAKYRAFAETCAEAAIHLEDNVIATDYLYYIYMLHRLDDVHETAFTVLRAFSRFYSLTPLEPLGLMEGLVETGRHIRHLKGDAEPDFLNGEKAHIFEPDPRAVTLIVSLEIRKAITRGSDDVSQLARFLKQLVATKRWPVFQEVFKNITFWNMLLYAYCRLQQFESASGLIKSMSGGDPEGTPLPNVFSWNLFLRAFFRADQVQAAERVYEVMKSRGVQPDNMTYTTLILGYARAENFEALGQIMSLVQEEDILNGEILNELMRIHDQKRMRLSLEQAKRDREKRQQMEAETERKKRWEMPQLKSILSPSFLSQPWSTLPTLRQSTKVPRRLSERKR